MTSTSSAATMNRDDLEAVPNHHDTVRSSVSKALELLEILAFSPQGEASLSELSLRIGLPKSTVHRLVTELCEHGLAGRIGVKYCTGLKLAELSARSQWSEHRGLLTVSTPILEWLFERTGNTVHLGVLRGFEVVYLEKISGPGGSRIPSRVGIRLPASCTSIGKALLAANGFADIVEQGRMRTPLPRMTPYSIRRPGVLAEQLRQCQATGLAFDNGETQVGVRCVAAPVLAGDQAVAAVSVSVFGSSCGPDRYSAAAVTEAARRIAAGLAGIA